MIKGYSISPTNRNKFRIDKLQSVKFLACHEIEPVELADGNYFVALDLIKENQVEIEKWLTRKGYANIINWLKTNVQDFDETTAFPQYDIDGNRIN